MNSTARTHTTGEEELARGNIPKLFVKFVIPGMLALFMLSAQLFIDGLLIGNFIGANAMGSVNLVIPIYDALIACAVVICVGCQCIIGMKLGCDDLQTANDTLRTGLVFALVAIGIAGALVTIFAPELVRLMGANDVLQDDAVTFIRVLAPFFPFPVVMYLFDAVLKSVGRPIYATIGMSAMVLSNVVLDLLFILAFEWGIAGAAFATGLSYLIGLSVYLPALLRKNSPVNLLIGRFKMKLVGKLLTIGSAEGVTELSACVVTLMFNLTMMHYAGEKGIVAFTAINYLNYVMLASIIGMSEGLRSIISYNYGLEAFSRIRKTLRRHESHRRICRRHVFRFLLFRERDDLALFQSRGNRHHRTGGQRHCHPRLFLPVQRFQHPDRRCLHVHRTGQIFPVDLALARLHSPLRLPDVFTVLHGHQGNLADRSAGGSLHLPDRRGAIPEKNPAYR